MPPRGVRKGSKRERQYQHVKKASANRAHPSNGPRRSRRAQSTRSAPAAASRRRAPVPPPMTSPQGGAVAFARAGQGHAGAPANSSIRRHAASASRAGPAWTRRSCNERSTTRSRSQRSSSLAAGAVAVAMCAWIELSAEPARTGRHSGGARARDAVREAHQKALRDRPESSPPGPRCRRHSRHEGDRYVRDRPCASRTRGLCCPTREAIVRRLSNRARRGTRGSRAEGQGGACRRIEQGTRQGVALALAREGGGSRSAREPRQTSRRRLRRSAGRPAPRCSPSPPTCPSCVPRLRADLVHHRRRLPGGRRQHQVEHLAPGRRP